MLHGGDAAIPLLVVVAAAPDDVVGAVVVGVADAELMDRKGCHFQSCERKSLLSEWVDADDDDVAVARNDFEVDDRVVVVVVVGVEDCRRTVVLLAMTKMTLSMNRSDLVRKIYANGSREDSKQIRCCTQDLI